MTEEIQQLKDELKELKDDLTERFKATRDYTDNIAGQFTTSSDIENSINSLERKLDGKISARPKTQDIINGLTHFAKLHDLNEKRIKLLEVATNEISRNEVSIRTTDELAKNAKEIQIVKYRAYEWYDVLKSIQYFIEQNQ
jgi:chromosome segregation ATPase